MADGIRFAPLVLMVDWPKCERPRERLLSRGPRSLSDAELLALVVGSAGRGSGGVMRTCRRLLSRFGGLDGLGRCRIGELMGVQGIGQARACAIVAVAELSRRQWGQPLRRGEPITGSHDVFVRLHGRLAGLAQEIFVVLALDARNRVLSVTQVAQGGVTSVEVHPREVFLPLLRESAAAGIVAHNHPSGDPEPSEGDHVLTERLLAASRLVGIPLLDHLVVGHDRYVSLADRGLL